ncbi:hypothetical protein K438DRAFT_1753844 [Mycena galopus ATCC 62051]|nr:hypothetical protein K438DRAFT_1753844 [Mycena galopus ATCC 62051]
MKEPTDQALPPVRPERRETATEGTNRTTCLNTIYTEAGKIGMRCSDAGVIYFEEGMWRRGRGTPGAGGSKIYQAECAGAAEGRWRLLELQNAVGTEMQKTELRKPQSSTRRVKKLNHLLLNSSVLAAIYGGCYTPGLVAAYVHSF